MSIYDLAKRIGKTPSFVSLLENGKQVPDVETITRIANGELDGAADAIAPVLGLPAERRINGVVHSARRVHQALRQSGRADDAVVDDTW